MKTSIKSVAAVLAAMSALLIPAVTFAAATPTLNQVVNAGTLTTDILQSDGSTPVASPSVTFTALNRSFACQTNTATLGDSSNKLYVTNFANNNGWNLTLSATGGPTATWSSTVPTVQSYKFNDPAGTTAGCTNGQMTVNPATGTITPDCSTVCDAVSVTKGSSTPFDSTTNASITIMTTSSGTAWKGYLTGVGLSQKVPASQPAGTYSLPMTLTAVAL